jgi:hypothetical protein
LSFTDSEKIIGSAEFNLGMYVTQIKDDNFVAKFQLGNAGNEGAGHHNNYPGAEIHLSIDINFSKLPENRVKNYSYINASNYTKV